MPRRTRRSQGSKAARTPRAPAEGRPEAVVARAVKTTRGRAATMVQVEVAPDRLGGPKGAREVEEVIAELPRVDGGRKVQWEQERLAKEADEFRPGAGRSLRYVATRYAPCDAPPLDIKVRVKTKAGTVTRGGIPVREAGKPDDEGR